MTPREQQHLCAHCGRPLPLGGVRTDTEARAHYVCAELMKRTVAELARQTVKRLTARGGR